MEFLKYHCNPQSTMNIHPGAEGVVFELQTLFNSGEAKIWNEKMKYLQTLDKDGKKALYKEVIAYKRRRFYEDGCAPNPYDSDNWTTFIRKTSEPIQYDFKPVNAEHTQMFVGVLLPFSP